MRNFSLTSTTHEIKCSFSPLHRSPTVRKTNKQTPEHSEVVQPHPFPFALHLLVREQVNKSGVRTQRYVLDLHDLTADWKSMKCSSRTIALSWGGVRWSYPHFRCFPLGFHFGFWTTAFSIQNLPFWWKYYIVKKEEILFPNLTSWYWQAVSRCSSSSVSFPQVSSS